VLGGCVEVDDIGVFVSAKTGEECDSPIIQSLDPFGGVMVPILYRDWDIDATVICLVPFRWLFTISSCFGQLRRQLVDPGLVLLTVLREEVSAVLDGGDEPENDLV
jgi:hypothetical protein